MSFIEESNTEVDFSLKNHLFIEEKIIVKRELDDFDNRNVSNEVEGDLDLKSIIKGHCYIKSEEENLETEAEINLSLKEHPLTAENTTLKRELDDFDNRQTANEVNQDLDQKFTFQIHSDIKSEEENSINNQYLIRPEEINIKCEDDVEQSDTQFKNHKVRHKPKDQIKIYKCPECSYQSKRKGDVKQHSVRHRKPDEIVWHQCPECPYKTGRKSNLKRHAVVHNETQQFDIFKCEHCIYKTPRKEGLKRHALVHCKDNISWIYCPEPECSYKTFNKTRLKRHSLVHSNDRFFKCTQCSFKTARQSDLKVHIWRHASSDQLKRYRCEQCPYKTHRKFLLRQHQKKHQDADDDSGWHKCPDCPYKTIHKYDLLYHAKKHKATSHTHPLQCSKCSYRTCLTNRLKEHEMLHNDAVEWFRCFHCQYKTNWKPSLLVHVKMHLQIGQKKLT